MDNTQLFDYLHGFVENMFLPVIVFFLPMHKRRHWAMFLPLTVVFLAVAIGLGMVLFPLLIPAPITGQLYFAFHYVLVFSAYGAGIFLMCESTRREVAYCTVCAYMTQHLCHCLNLILNHFLNSPDWLNSSIGGWIQQIIICLAVWFLFARKICHKGHYPNSALRSIGLLAFVMAVMFFLSIYVSEFENGWLHGLYTAMLIMILMYEELHSASQLRLQKEAQARERMEALHRAQYEMSKENIKILNRKSHDLRRQVAALRMVGTPEEQAEAIAEIEQAVEIYDSTFRTGCRALDTVLMQKALICSQNHIELSAVADGTLLRFIKSVDLFTMLSNILDNAIEANLRIKDEAKRAIHLSVHDKRGLVILQCENPYEGIVEMKDGLPVTIKEDKVNHGIGTQSVAATAAEYGGVLRIDPGGGMYVLRIIFQPPDTSQDEKTTSQDKAV